MANDLEVKRYYWSASSKTSTGEAVTIDSVDTSKAFVRAINTLWGANNGGATNYIKDLGAAPAVTGATTCTVNLAGSASNSNVREGYVEVWEYTGPVGGSSEVKVLHHGVETLTGTSTVVTLDNTASNIDNCVAIYGGLIGPAFANTAITVGDQAAVRLEVTATNQLTMSRFDGTTDVEVSVTVLEFVGSDWTVHKYNGSHPTSTAGSATHSLGFSVSDWANSFFFFSHEVASGNTGADDITILPYVGSSTTSQIKTWHNVSSAAPPEFTLYVVEHASASVEHNDTLDGTVPQGTFKPTTTITAPTSYALSTAVGFNGATSDPTSIVSSAAWTGWLSDSTTFATDYGAGSTDELMQTGFQIIDLDAVAGSTLTAVSVGRPSETDSSQAVTHQKIRQITLGVASESDSAPAITAKRTYYITLGAASESDASNAVAAKRIYYVTLGAASESDVSSTVTAKRTYYVTVGAAAETSTAPSVAVAKHTSVGIAGELSAEPFVGIDYSNGTSVSFYGVADTLFESSAGSGFSSTTGPLGEADAAILPWEDNYLSGRGSGVSAGGFTIAYWWKQTRTAGTGGAVRHVYAQEVASPLDGFQVLHWDASNIYIRRYLSGGWTDFSYSNSTALLDGEWHHVAHVVNNDNTSISLYIDGEFVSSIAETITIPDSNDVFWGPRHGWTNGTVELDVAIPAFEVFDVALTAEQIATLPGQINHYAGAPPVTATKYVHVEAAFERPAELIPQVALDFEPLPSRPVNYGWDQSDIPDGLAYDHVVMPNGEKAIELPWVSKYTGVDSIESHQAGSTVAFWLKLDITLGDGYSTRSLAWNVNSSLGQNIIFYSTGEIRIRRYHAGGWDQQTVYGGTDALTQDWHHYAATLSEDLTTVKFYIDGELVSTITDSYVAPPDAYANFRGWSGWTSGDGSESIDLWQGPQEVYNRELSEPEIKAVMQQLYRGAVGAQQVVSTKYSQVQAATEGETVYDVAADKLVSVASSSSAESAAAVSADKYAELGPTTSVDSSVAVSTTKYVTVGVASTGFTATPVSAVKYTSVAAGSSTESALAVSTDRSVTVANVPETNSALPLDLVKYVTVAPATVGMVATDVNVAKYTTLTSGDALETATGVQVVKYASVVDSPETDATSDVAPTKIISLTGASETGALTSVAAVKHVTVSSAGELDSTFSVTTEATVTATAVKAQETDSTSGPSVVKYVAVGTVNGTEAATTLSVTRFLNATGAGNTETAVSVADFRVSTAAVASTPESALPVTTYRVVTPGAALETQVATGTTFFKDHRVSPALETSVASVVSYADGVKASVGVAREFEDVLDVTTVAYVPVVEALGVDQARPVKTAKFTTLTAVPASVETVPEVLVTKSIELVRAFGGENARPVKPRHVSSPDSIVETNAANTVSVAKYTAVGAASCNEAATVATATRIIYVAQTNETDDSGSISYDKFLKGATETDTAVGVFWVKKHKFVSSAAIEAAECRNFSAARCLN